MIEWYLLGFSGPINDVKEIKKAYAKKAKEIHPEEYPEEFQRLQYTYKAALNYANSKKKQKYKEDYQDYYAALSKKEEIKPIETSEEILFSDTSATSQNTNFDYTVITEPEIAIFMEHLKYICSFWYTRNNISIWSYLIERVEFNEIVYKEDFQIKMIAFIKTYNTITQKTLNNLKKYIKNIRVINLLNSVIETAPYVEEILEDVHDEQEIKTEIESIIKNAKFYNYKFDYVETRLNKYMGKAIETIKIKNTIINQTSSDDEAFYNSIKIVCQYWYTRNNIEIWNKMFEYEKYKALLDNSIVLSQIIIILSANEYITKQTLKNIYSHVSDSIALKQIEKLISKAIEIDKLEMSQCNWEFAEAMKFEVNNCLEDARIYSRDWNYLLSRILRISNNEDEILNEYLKTKEKLYRKKIEENEQKRQEEYARCEREKQDNWKAWLWIAWILFILFRCLACH